jgi:hypothetical protein
MNIVRCDHCDWQDTVKVLRHFRAWYGVACPECERDAGDVVARLSDRLGNDFLDLVPIEN